jgi:hypothetical protein
MPLSHRHQRIHSMDIENRILCGASLGRMAEPSFPHNRQAYIFLFVEVSLLTIRTGLK